MIRIFGVGLVLAFSVIPAARAADLVQVGAYAPEPFILAPECTQIAPPIGIDCVPRGEMPAPDPRTVRSSVEFDRTRLRRPYRQLFSWGP